MKIPAPVLAVLLAAGCASYDGRGLQPGVSTEAQVRGLMGTPSAEYAGPGGSKTLAYAHGPLGIQTYMADMGGDGRLAAPVRPVLNEQTFYTISVGMTRDQVLRLIGPPGETMSFPRTSQVAWDYRFIDAWNYAAVFSVTFDSGGNVVSKFTRRIERGRGKD